MARLKEKYQREIFPKLKNVRNISNAMEVPRLTKISLNVGIHDSSENVLKTVLDNLATISGQKAVLTKAKKDVSNFKIRKGNVVGCRVTLRRERMYEFLDRLINIAIPRIRDFRGVSRRAFDGTGNYNLGIQEISIFPEIDADKIEFDHGLDVSIVTTAGDDELAMCLFEMFGMPFGN